MNITTTFDSTIHCNACIEANDEEYMVETGLVRGIIELATHTDDETGEPLCSVCYEISCDRP